MFNKISFMIIIRLLSFLFILNFSACATETSSSINTYKDYKEQVKIPKYNANDSTHVLITPSNGKWNEKVLNDPNKRHFYIRPGKYHKLARLTQDGKANDRRTISLYNGNNLHPASLPLNQIADVRLRFKGASYWIIDRLSNINDTTTPSFLIYKESTNNILNRLHIKNYMYGVSIEPFCHHNTVQNSYLDHMTHKGRVGDKVGLALANSKIRGAQTIGTKFINNDIRNAGDGIQLVVSSGLSGSDVSYPGTIVDSNRIWVDSSIYTNGNYATDGYNKDGEYMIAENAIDMKTGSHNPKKPVIISNNIMWGYHKGDESVDGSFSGSNRGVALRTIDMSNVKIQNNIILDSQTALSIVNSSNIDVSNNIFTQLNKVNPLDSKAYGVFVYTSKAVKITKNTFVDIQANSLDKGYVMNYDETINSPFSKNVLINTAGTRESFGNSVNQNFVYDVLNFNFNGRDDQGFYTAAEAKMDGYRFEYERFTSKSKYKTIKGVVTSNASPHYDKAGSNIGVKNYVSTSLSQKYLLSSIIAFSSL